MRLRLLLLTLAGLAARLIFLAWEPRIELAGDESSWVALGVHGLAELKRPLNPFAKHIIFYPPGYPYFIAVFYRLLGSLEAVKWAQALLGASLVPAVGLLGARTFSARVGLAGRGHHRLLPRAHLVLRPLLVGDPVRGLPALGPRARAGGRRERPGRPQRSRAACSVGSPP